MEPWYKFILYGTYDGFSRSTLGDDNLYLVLENGEKVEIPRCFVKNASDFIEKDKLKLKDVIARIKKLDLGTQKVWLNEILNELGSDYGTLKYKAGYEQGKFEGALIHCEEPQKITVPQFVADWIERSKQEKRNLRNALNNGGEKMRLWFLDLENYDTFARAWIDGYDVEEEKRYRVKMKGVNDSYCVLTHYEDGNRWIMGTITNNYISCKLHTKKQLEDAGFGWVFDCPGIEIEEVE